MSEESRDPQSDASAGGGGARRIILFTLLGVMIAALAYDYLVARPRVSSAYDQITEASTKANAKGGDMLTNTEVRELLGKEPVETFMDGGQSVEVFHYMGGLLVKPHKLYTVYRKSGDDWMFSRHSKFAYDSSQDVGSTELQIIDIDPDADPDAEYEGEANVGGGPQAGGGRRGGDGQDNANKNATDADQSAADKQPAADDASPEEPKKAAEDDSEAAPEGDAAAEASDTKNDTKPDAGEKSSEK